MTACPFVEKIDIRRMKIDLMDRNIPLNIAFDIGPRQWRQIPGVVAKEFAELATIIFRALECQQMAGGRHKGQARFVSIFEGAQIEKDT
jgi:hypothetical protein